MIRSTLEIVSAKLDAFFQASNPRTEEWVLLSNVIDHEGRAHEQAKNKIVVSLAGIQHETIISTHQRTIPVGGGQYGVVSPPLYVNLLVLFVANFNDQNYKDGLGMLGSTISFFQQNPYLSHDNTPNLDPAIEKLTIEMMNVDLTQSNYLMGMMGLKYLPAVLYRLRTLPFRSDAISGVVPPARGADTNQAPDPTA
jgi:hypothetical protein